MKMVHLSLRFLASFALFLGVNLHAQNAPSTNGDKPAPVATVKITAPVDGAELPAGVDLPISAVAVDPNGYIPRLEFYLDGQFLDLSLIAFFRAPDPGTPIEHSAMWKGPTPGTHVLTAKGIDSQGTAVNSEPVHVTVNEQQSTRSVVSIVAIDPEGTELPPFVDAIDPLGFEISRTGPTNLALQVFFSLHGTATPGTDYFEVPSSVSIPAGERLAILRIVPKSDLLTVVEPMETVGVRLEPSPEAGPLPTYEIDPGQGEAAGVIYELRPPEHTTLELVFPSAGDGFSVGQAITILAAIYRPEGYLQHVDFYDSDHVIGSSDILLNPLPGGKDPSLAFHQFVWKDAAAGEHVLTARATLPDGTQVTSSKVLITVKSSGVDLAHIEITSPKQGDMFQTGSDIPMTAVAVDQESYIARVEFYANDQKIGVSEITFIRAPDPGTPITHNFIWKNAPAGGYALTARGVNSQGQVVISEPVKILVSAIGGGDRVVLAVEAVDPRASETTADGQPDNAVFAIRRIAGPENVEVFVNFALSGSAINGVDYSKVEPSAVIAAGSDAVEVVIKPIPDNVLEGEETVELTLEEAVCAAIFPPLPSCYLIGDPHSARAVIRDSDQHTSEAKIVITAPKDGDSLPAGADIPLTAVAVDPNGYIARVEFFANDQQIGVSELVFIRAPGPGTPITHQFSWKNPAPGTYLLTARGTDSLKNAVTSLAVKILVKESIVGLLPKVEIVRPKDGAYFDPGQLIEISAAALDPDGQIERLDILADGNLLGSTKLNTLTTVWTNAPAGEHKIVARTVDSSGLASESTVVRVMVGKTPPSGAPFVERQLPDSYSAGVPLTVQLVVQPPAGTAAYAVEDQPPKGWSVGDVSNDGVFDPVTGRVKFGPYTDGQNRTLTYRTIPPANASGIYEFTGTSSADGTSAPIGGDRIIQQSTNLHPADSNQDARMTINEATAYAAAWKNGANWDVAPNPIPINYVTRAGMLWRNGEAYHYDSTQAAPLCWVPDQPRALALELSASSASAVRSITRNQDGSLTATVHVNPGSDASAYALDEKLPEGWTATSESGAFDMSTRTVRWGLFADNTERSLHYTLKAPVNAVGIPEITGRVSVDGQRVVTISADRPWISAVERAPDRSFHLKMQGPAEQVYVLESSPDLKTWTPENSLFLPDGQLDYSPDDRGANAHRYYRLRAR